MTSTCSLGSCSNNQSFLQLYHLQQASKVVTIEWKKLGKILLEIGVTGPGPPAHHTHAQA